MRLLTTTEAAEYLRLKERKLYEMVSENAIPCTKITGRWLFPKDALDRWLASSLVRPDGMAAVEPMLKVTFWPPGMGLRSVMVGMGIAVQLIGLGFPEPPSPWISHRLPFTTGAPALSSTQA